MWTFPENLLKHVARWGLALLLVACFLAYYPGLSGGFLFDDFINLNALGNRGPIDDWPAFWRYVTSGTADPTGRPLSLLTFLLDARNWPADPKPFLRTNVLLHLINGALLFVLLRKLGRHMDGIGVRTDVAALLAAGLWMLHPLFVSTTLYIVQREAMLPASFIALGLLAYLHGRQIHLTRPRAGMAWMSAGIGLGTVLAVLCKANGALLPLLALVLETTVLRAGDGAAAGAIALRMRWARRILLVLPSVALVAWLLLRMPALDADLAHRPWTMAERLLTQPRVLLDYLELLLVPRVLSPGVFNDGYVASTGWLQPASTLPALLFVLALLGIAWMLRRSAPAWSVALLFWFAGHLLESSVVALELYFEHRNYLPAMLFFWPLGRAFARWPAGRMMRIGIAVALLTMLAGLTWQRATLWGQPDRMALLWAARNPESPRAQAHAASAELRTGMPKRALARLGPLAAAHPYELQYVLGEARAACLMGYFDTTTSERVHAALRDAQYGYVMGWRWLGSMLDVAVSGRCKGLQLATIARWADTLARNPGVDSQPGRRQDVEALKGRLALAQNQPAAALVHFNQALEEWPTPQAAGEQAAILASAGYYSQALAHLDFYARIQSSSPTSGPKSGMPWIHAMVLERQGFWQKQLQELRGNLQAELAPDETTRVRSQ